MAQPTAVQIGDRVYSAAIGQDGRVTRIQGDFATVQFPTGEHMLPLESLAVVTTDPLVRIANVSFDPEPAWFDIRLRAARLKAAYGSDDLSGLVNSRVILRPHQIFVAHRILEKPRPSMILADEVGLGKTVEAGLVLKELLARRSVARVLLIVPPNLISQWQTELRIKFNELFELVDRQALEHARQLRPGRNPWLSFPRAVMSSYLARSADLRDDLAAGEWDLVIIDEAHHCRRTRAGKGGNVTELYRTADALKDTSFGMMLLTATPMQLDPFEAFSLVELVEPGLYDGYQDFENEVFGSQELKWLVRTLQAWDDASGAEREQAGVLALGEGLEDDLDSPLGREDAIEGLLGSIRIGTAMVRNRKRTVGGFTKRRAVTSKVPLSEEEQEAHQELEAYLRLGFANAKGNSVRGLELVTYQRILASSSRALVGALQTRRKRLLGMAQSACLVVPEGDELADDEAAGPEPVIAEDDAELALLDPLIARFSELSDTKPRALLKLVRDLIQGGADKILIFTQYLATQDLLRELLEPEFSVVIFRGSLSRIEKDVAVQEFRRRAQVMISTEAGGEGRNFQFCRTVINYDLHWNPMRIEQRIGRLDRYGQKRNVHIYNLIAKGTIEDRLVDIFEQRLNLFEATVGGLELILGDIEESLVDAILTSRGNLDEAVAKFDRALELRLKDAVSVEEKSADFLIELGSYNEAVAKRLTEGLEEGRLRTDLELLVLHLLDYFPTARVVPEGDVYTITPPPVLERTTGQRLEKSYHGTFSPAAAVQDESLDFFAFGHPLVDACLEYALSELTSGSVGKRSLPRHLLAAPAVELNYLVEFIGIRRWAEIISLAYSLEANRDRELEASLPLAEPTSQHGPMVSSDAMERVRQAAGDDVARVMQSRLAELVAMNQRRADDELARAQRVHSYNLRRLDGNSERIHEQIARLEEEGDPERLRIIPALRGRLEATGRERLQLDSDLEVKTRDVEAHRQVTPTATLVSAAVLLPEQE